MEKQITHVASKQEVVVKPQNKKKEKRLYNLLTERQTPKDNTKIGPIRSTIDECTPKAPITPRVEAQKTSMMWGLNPSIQLTNIVHQAKGFDESRYNSVSRSDQQNNEQLKLHQHHQTERKAPKRPDEKVPGIFSKPSDLFFNHTPRDSIDMISSIRSQSKVPPGKDQASFPTGEKVHRLTRSNTRNGQFLLWNQTDDNLIEEDHQ